MISRRDFFAGLGSIVTSAGFGILSYNFYSTAVDSTIAKTAATCLQVEPTTSTKLAQAIKTSARFLLPRAMPLAENAAISICSTATKLNSYSLTMSIGCGVIATGALIFGLSRCFTLKTKTN